MHGRISVPKVLPGGFMYSRILVPTDGSDMSKRAVQTACSLAKLCGAKVVVLSIKSPFPYSAISEMQPVPPQEFYDAQERMTGSWVKEAQAIAQEAGVPSEGFSLESLHPWEGIVEQARAQGCDLVVMASHGRRGISALLLGSETTRVLTHCTLPVLVVR
jgi:nucleotide-binding universal stress UspA family protein